MLSRSYLDLPNNWRINSGNGSVEFVRTTNYLILDRKELSNPNSARNRFWT